MGQSMSFGLTQYDVDELIADCKGVCAPGCWGFREVAAVRVLPAAAPQPATPSRLFCRPAPCAVTQQEVESLYRRFRSLDRGRKVGAARGGQLPVATNQGRPPRNGLMLVAA